MRTTKLLALVLLAAACQKDTGTSRFAADPEAAPLAHAGGGGDLETRVARLEAEAAKNKEALEFLNQVYGQQQAQMKAQKEEEERRTAAPDAVFAVSIDGNAYDGPVGAPVTIVEAWDFA